MDVSDKVAKKTFWVTFIGVALYITAVLVYAL